MRASAGILLFRRGSAGIEVLIAHPGGPIWAKRDDGAWSIPKGELEPGEEPADAALREFEEETGASVADEPLMPLGTIEQRSGKVVHAFAVEGDFDPDGLESNLIEITWPYRSGHKLLIPEIDRVAWVDPGVAVRKLNTAQGPFIDRLLELVAPDRGPP